MNHHIFNHYTSSFLCTKLNNSGTRCWQKWPLFSLCLYFFSYFSSPGTMYCKSLSITFGNNVRYNKQRHLHERNPLRSSDSICNLLFPSECLSLFLGQHHTCSGHISLLETQERINLEDFQHYAQFVSNDCTLFLTYFFHDTTSHHLA